jgi:L-amino acid N-acyltransferase YncA
MTDQRTEAAQANPATQPRIFVRPSRDDDVPAMLAIYRYHIARGVGDLGEYVPEELNTEDLKRRRKNMRGRRLPHLAAERGREIVGYAYAVLFRKRPAYRYAVKHSIYVRHDAQHEGVGRMLLTALIDACAAADYRQMIGYIDGANVASLKLHEACGFRQVGRLPSIAYKFGHWADSIIVQRSLGLGDSALPGEWTSTPFAEAEGQG